MPYNPVAAPSAFRRKPKKERSPIWPWSGWTTRNTACVPATRHGSASTACHPAPTALPGTGRVAIGVPVHGSSMYTWMRPLLRASSSASTVWLSCATPKLRSAAAADGQRRDARRGRAALRRPAGVPERPPRRRLPPVGGRRSRRSPPPGLGSSTRAPSSSTASSVLH